MEITESGGLTVPESFAEFVRNRRGALSHEAVRARARAAGDNISVTTLSKIERGLQTGITVEKARVLAKALGLSDHQTAALMRYTTPEAKGREITALRKRVESLEVVVDRLNAQLDRLVTKLEQLQPPED